jgi:hypothetical protein
MEGMEGEYVNLGWSWCNRYKSTRQMSCSKQNPPAGLPMNLIRGGEMPREGIERIAGIAS